MILKYFEIIRITVLFLNFERNFQMLSDITKIKKIVRTINNRNKTFIRELDQTVFLYNTWMRNSVHKIKIMQKYLISFRLSGFNNALMTVQHILVTDITINVKTKIKLDIHITYIFIL